jgi:O-antigen/teichoic acid export membrane protein
MLRPFFYQFGATMDAIGKPQLNFWYNLLLMCINFSFTYIGLHWIGRDGAAYALVAHHIVSLIIIYPVLKKHVHIDMRNIVKYAIGNYKYMFNLVKSMVFKSGKNSGSSNGSSSNGAHEMPVKPEPIVNDQ